MIFRQLSVLSGTRSKPGGRISGRSAVVFETTRTCGDASPFFLRKKKGLASPQVLVVSKTTAERPEIRPPGFERVPLKTESCRKIITYDDRGVYDATLSCTNRTMLTMLFHF